MRFDRSLPHTRSDAPRKKPQDLRSQQWFGRQDRDGFAYRSWVKGKGIPHDQFDGRPVIGICNTFSELTPCNSHFRTLAEQVKIGVYEAGGFPLEFPVMSLGETLLRNSCGFLRGGALIVCWLSRVCVLGCCGYYGMTIESGCGGTRVPHRQQVLKIAFAKTRLRARV